LTALEAGLVQFFGGALGCLDGTISTYTGSSLTSIHQPLGIPLAVFNDFNEILVNALLADGVNQTDASAVLALLQTLQSQIVYTSNSTSSFCQTYSAALSVTNYQLLSLVINETVIALVSNSTTLPFFNGATPFGSTNFLSPTEEAALVSLEAGLIEFFGSVLGCTDGTIAPYTGRQLYNIHRNMGITQNDFLTFNALLLGVLQSNGVQPTDLDFVNSILLSTQSVIVQSGPIQGNYMSSPLNYSQLIAIIVLSVVLALIIMALLGLMTWKEPAIQNLRLRALKF